MLKLAVLKVTGRLWKV